MKRIICFECGKVMSGYSSSKIGQVKYEICDKCKSKDVVKTGK